MYDGENFPINLSYDFDVIICQESVCHVKNKQNIFTQLYKHLKINGIIYIQDWFVTDSKYINIKNINLSNYYFKTYIESMNMYLRYFDKFRTLLLQYLDVRSLPKNNLYKMFMIGEIYENLSDIDKGGQYLSRAFYDGTFTIGILVLQKK